MSFDLALSGINAANTDLNVTSNNLANVDTTGFKESRAEFADLFAQTQGGVAQTAVGNGVQVAEIAQQFGNGNTTNTGNNLDLALSGSGFFIVSDNGALNYTRDGAFQVDQNGFLVTASGEQVQGYAPLANGGFNTGGLTSIQLNTAESAPQATTTAGVALNLPSNATAPTNTPLNPADPTTYTDTTSMTVYDSLGAAHTAQLYFLKGATANNWTTQLYVDGNAVGTGQALTFSNTGVLTTPANGQVNFGPYTPTTGAAAMNITFNFGQSTQDGDAFGVTGVSPNGYTTGSLTGISIGSTGVVQANFTNGQSKNLGQIALANFANPQGLQQEGNNQWQQTFDSGDAVHGAAGGSGFAAIQSGELESSNVDITTQLVNMITAERVFQANAQMISATDQVTQSIINIPNG
ncbi:MAG TPA: flagellar hook protein FlgE [Steroidobacteraceae bacterium]|nr:flagellar hook protein FlgE [Steroidobacteraceae bacterium]